MTTDWLLTLGRQACLVAPDGRRWALDGVAALLALRLALAGPSRATCWPASSGRAYQRRGRAATCASGCCASKPNRPRLGAEHRHPGLQTPVQRLGAELLLPDLHLPTDDELGLWLDDARRRWRQATSTPCSSNCGRLEVASRLDDALRLAVDAIGLQPEPKPPGANWRSCTTLAHDRARALRARCPRRHAGRVHGTAP